MITPQDKELLENKGISEEQIAEQLACFEKGFPYLKLSAAASVEKGILAPDTDEQKKFQADVQPGNHMPFAVKSPREHIGVGWVTAPLPSHIPSKRHPVPLQLDICRQLIIPIHRVAGVRANPRQFLRVRNRDDSAFLSINRKRHF